MTKLRLIPRDEDAEARFWLDRTKSLLSPDPVERDAALARFDKPPALTAIRATNDDEGGYAGRMLARVKDRSGAARTLVAALLMAALAYTALQLEWIIPALARIIGI